MPPEGGDIFTLALTHRSFAFEKGDGTEHNERLEFLGDAILGAVVTDLIFRDFPTLAEGEMARLRASAVNTHALADLARGVGLGDHIRLGKGEESSGGRDKPSLLADTLEALIGAVYLERGIETVSEVLVPLFRERLRATVAAGGRYDAKTALQEIVVRERGGFPEYRVVSEGPDHDKRFTAEVVVGGSMVGAGSGKSKKEAEQNAAREALQRLGTVSGPDHGERGPDARAS